ncbi:multidrug permease ABC transporter [Bifidobacterium ramosum]|uniref:ABC transporter permease n=1 Tax=Bifidobacterium ramosum TaxID=1798158 RepID=A0A6L4X013_9BIFI|nr:ABC transporter permease [Bifidobacterium ramosum]KAB8287445.1 multidrug permease ABC transporter [Bifidobacterium ramosum]NEG72165.1 ABC transporter permease [Bifidobacterium ramosum]
MNTCKATVRVLIAHRTYIIIYLVLMGVMMFTLSWSQITAANRPVADTYEPAKVNVAVVDRDDNRGGIAGALRDYLSESATLIDLKDDSESLQQAVASNWTDLIVIIPNGYADRFLAAARSGGAMPQVETVTSYASGAGTIGGMNVSGFLSLVRIALIGGHAHIDQAALKDWYVKMSGGAAGVGASAGQNTGTDGDWSKIAVDPSAFDIESLPEGTMTDLTMDDVKNAADSAAKTAHDADINRTVAVEKITSKDKRDAGTVNPVASGFGDTMKTAVYPLFLTLSVCVSLVSRVFGAGELRRRLAASPVAASIGLKRMGVLCVFALLICVAYLIAALGLTAAAGADPTVLPTTGVAMTFGSACMFSLMCVACGFMLGEFGASDTAANGFANVFGLLIMFTSGIAFPVSMMPDAIVPLVTLTPGWWYTSSIDAALGVGTGGANVAGWLSGSGIVALYAVTFVCIGLAVGRMRRMRPLDTAPATTQLAEA